MKMVRFVKIFLVFSVGIWGLLGAVGNLVNLSDVYSQVSDVSSMTGIPEDIGPPWKTTSPLVIWIGVISIVLGKLAALVGGLYGGAIMLKNVNATPSDFKNSKKWAVAGCGMAFALTFLSFTIAAESAFFMFFNPGYEGAGELAFRLAGSFALVTVFVAQTEMD